MKQAFVSLAATRAAYALEVRQCSSRKALQELCSRISQSELQGDTMLSNVQVQMYGRLGCVDDARSVFDAIRVPNIFSWNFIINAYAHNGRLQDAMRLFHQMEAPNEVTWNSIIAAHAHDGHLQTARDLFDRSPVKGVVSWNVMIAAYGQSGNRTEALKHFYAMKLEGFRPNTYTFVAALAACSTFSQGESVEAQIHDAGLSSNAVTGTSLIEMYGRSGSLSNAWRLFEALPVRDKIVWTVMLSAYSKNRCMTEAQILFQKLPTHDLVVATIHLSALTANGCIDAARQLFESLPHQDDMCRNAMTVAYAQHGYLNHARKLFDSMYRPDCISWNVMITAYAQNRHGKEALELFQIMEIEGEQPTINTLSSIFDACAALGLFPQGKIVHNSFVDTGIQSDVVVGTSLVNMYGRCGSLEHARRLFDQMQERNLLTWTAMVAAYAQNGHGKSALHLFHLMELDGVQADDIIFKNVLYACGQSGLSSRSWHYFRSIRGDYGFVPGVEHYKIMIDLLGRSGKLAEAQELIDNMPFQPDQIAWTSFLSACRVQGDKAQASHAAETVVEMEPANRGGYALLTACQMHQ